MQQLLQILIVMLLFGKIFSSCQTACVDQGYTTSQIVGVGPFCNGRCWECGEGAFCLSKTWFEGGACFSGSKACCCRGKVNG